MQDQTTQDELKKKVWLYQKQREQYQSKNQVRKQPISSQLKVTQQILNEQHHDYLQPQLIVNQAPILRENSAKSETIFEKSQELQIEGADYAEANTLVSIKESLTEILYSEDKVKLNKTKANNAVAKQYISKYDKIQGYKSKAQKQVKLERAERIHNIVDDKIEPYIQVCSTQQDDSQSFEAFKQLMLDVQQEITSHLLYQQFNLQKPVRLIWVFLFSIVLKIYILLHYIVSRQISFSISDPTSQTENEKYKT
ncbi:Hypothetical_protein [Hexamita inflata]|uniref:Hypothetical_protein n=1 Tax=Hexamita inflata TaxID=28002 RepID=A0ABP1HCA1_9EUKA